MKTKTIEDILNKDETDAGDVVKSIKGKITKLFDPRKGGDGDKKWEFQNGELMDATGKIKIVFSKNSQPRTARNKEVLFESKKTDNFGWQGVKVEDDEYENKEGEKVKERILKITPSADIKFMDENGSDKPKGETRTEYFKEQTRPEIKDVKKHFNDILNLYKVCYGHALDLAGNVPPEVIPPIAATLFIECNKHGMAYDFVNKYAAKPKEDEDKPKEESKSWRHVVVPKGEFKDKTLEEIPEEKLKELYVAYDESEDGFNTSFAKAVKKAYRARIEDDIPS